MSAPNTQPPTIGPKAGANESGGGSRISPCGTHARRLCVAFTAWLTWLSFMASAADAPSFRFQTNDVIAFVGGEDVVEMQRNGYLELLLTAALPHHKLRCRNLAFEGDTVFEQHRQLNFPSWEEQLERVGATVVVAQFGQAESLQGTNGLPRFVEAYAKLLDRFTNGGRRLILLSPTPCETSEGLERDFALRIENLGAYSIAISNLAIKRGARFLFNIGVARRMHERITRDGLHLNQTGHWRAARSIAQQSAASASWHEATPDQQTGALPAPAIEKLRQLILEKNRLWFDYWRPQNWAFLHGDRTEQPSSRDHRDPKKRWFPEEMEKFLPLIEAKEKEIWEAAQKLR